MSLKKRAAGDNLQRAEEESDGSSSSDDDDDFGPSLGGSLANNAAANEDDKNNNSSSSTKGGANKAKKLKKSNPHEQLFLDSLPSTDFYEKSYMNRSLISHIAISKPTEYIITASQDGLVYFWKKMLTGIEFVKRMQAHLAAINALVLSGDGLKLATTSVDRTIKFFDVTGFDLVNFIEVSFVPTAAVWLSGHRGVYTRLAVADLDSPKIRVFNSESASATALKEIDFHPAPVCCMAFNAAFNVVISCDNRGIIEYWSSNFDVVEEETSSSSASSKSVGVAPIPNLHFRTKSETDLYALAKQKATPVSISLSNSCDSFVILSKDKSIWVFDFAKGKLKRKYDESLKTFKESSNKGGGILDEKEIKKREDIEKELENGQLESSVTALSSANVIFDESGCYLIYGSLLGIKVLSIEENRVVRTIGMGESGERFLFMALYQGVPKVDMQYLLSKANSDINSKTADQLRSDPVPDPTIYCTSFKRHRFYCFSRRDPDESKEPRDVFNEKPTEDDRLAALEKKSGQAATVYKEVVVHTSKGDFTIKLFPTATPLTYENFITHAKNGFYNNIIFHRVIKGFMLQTGDPQGDGTGGTSIWNREFKDEIVNGLNHSKPYTVSMANCGPNTNGSQFFITTVPCPHLDGKHTVFGKISSGYGVIDGIEGVKTSKNDRPLEKIVILSMELKE